MTKIKQSSQFSELLAQVPRLTPAQLRQLKVRVDIALALTPAEPAEDYLLDGINHEVRRRGLFFQPLTPAKIRRFAPNYDAYSAQVRDQLPKFSQPAMRAALGQLAARALADWIEANRPTLSLTRMFSLIRYVPEAIDAAFPGYLEAGVLGFLLENNDGKKPEPGL